MENKGEKIVAAALTTSLILGGCQAQNNETYSANTKSVDPVEEVSGYAEGYDENGIFVEVDEKDETPRIVFGPALIKPNAENNDIILVYPGQAQALDSDFVVWEFDAETPEKMIEILESQVQFFPGGNIERVTGEEDQGFKFAEGYDDKGLLLSNQTIEGPAFIKINSYNDDVIRLNPGESYTIKGEAIVWKYDGGNEEKIIEGLDSQEQFFTGEILPRLLKS